MNQLLVTVEVHAPPREPVTVGDPGTRSTPSSLPGTSHGTAVQVGVSSWFLCLLCVCVHVCIFCMRAPYFMILFVPAPKYLVNAAVHSAIVQITDNCAFHHRNIPAPPTGPSQTKTHTHTHTHTRAHAPLPPPTHTERTHTRTRPDAHGARARTQTHTHTHTEKYGKNDKVLTFNCFY